MTAIAAAPRNRRSRVDVTPAAAPPLAPRIAKHLRALGARRGIRAALRIAIALGLVAGCLSLARVVEQRIRTWPAFAVREVQIEGNSRLTDEEIARAAGLAPGANAFDVTPTDARERVRAMPWVREASVERRLPGTFRIRVIEHEPLALIALERDLYLVASDGQLFKRFHESDPADLPVITGVDRERFVSEAAYRRETIDAVLLLLHEHRTENLEVLAPIEEVSVDGSSLSVVVRDEATRVVLGRAPFRAKLRRLRALLDRATRDHAILDVVYLDNAVHPGRVVVRVRPPPGGDVPAAVEPIGRARPR